MARTGRPPILTDDKWNQVLGAISTGSPMQMAAESVGMSRRGLQKAIKRSSGKKKELKEARDTANDRIEKKIYDKAIAGDNTMLIWWSKNHMGYKDRLEKTVDPDPKSRVYRSHITSDDKVATDDGESPAPQKDPPQPEKDSVH